jgi:type IV secretory pathway VirB9-like protein
MKFIATLLLSTALASPALALDPCKPTPTDQNVRVCDYSPEQRYVVTAVVGYPVDLEFGSDERIKRYELAYTGRDKNGLPAQTWRGPKAKDGQSLPVDRYKSNLPIWAFEAGHSGLVVVTARPDGNERSYAFDLVAREAAADCTASPQGPACPGDAVTTATLMFDYPADVAAAKQQEQDAKRQVAIAAWRARQVDLKEQQAIGRLKTDVFYGTQNYAYQAKAERRFRHLAPSKVSDNGWLTEMQWPGNVQIPAITILDPASGQERLPAITHQNGMEVINGTAAWFRLRLGPAVMDIHNLNWSPHRPDPKTGTTSPDVVREVLYKAGQP